MSQPPSTPTPRPPPARLKKVALRLLALAAVVCVLYLFRAPLLRVVGGVLVVDETAQPGDVVLLLGADRGYDLAAERYRDGSAPRVLILEGPPGRLVRLGVLDTAGAMAHKALPPRGVTKGGFTVIACPGSGDWNRARGLRGWLEENPDARVAVLCERLNSRRVRRIFRTVLGDELAGRVRWCAVPNREWDETNWWQHKAGVFACVNGYLGLAHVCVYGENPTESQAWNPDQYGQTLPRPQ